MADETPASTSDDAPEDTGALAETLDQIAARHAPKGGKPVMRRAFGAGLILIVVLAVFAVVNARGGLTIEQVAAAPDQYVGQIVTLSGTVGTRAAFGALSGYKLMGQEGGSLWVKTEDIPAQGTRQKVSGKVSKWTTILYLDATVGGDS